MFFKWLPGRHGGYEKMLLFAASNIFGKWLFNLPGAVGVGADCWLIRVPGSTRIHSHRDEVTNGRHYRLNIALKLPEDSKFQIGGWPIFQLGQRVVLFRPDLMNHWLSKASGERLFLSIGWVLRAPKK